jgi:hypothetical protein
MIRRPLLRLLIGIAVMVATGLNALIVISAPHPDASSLSSSSESRGPHYSGRSWGPAAAAWLAAVDNAAPIPPCVVISVNLGTIPEGCGNPSCGVVVQNPHYSSGAGGVIAKFNFSCDPGVSTIGYSLFLFLCSSSPQGQPESSWGAYGCAIKSETSGSVTSPPLSFTRYIPATGGDHGTGYWIACTVYSYTVKGVYYGSYTQAGNAQFVSA